MGTVPFLLALGFTLVELLVTITIIGMLAGMMLGALQMARNSAREAATKATIAKLNSIIMQRYESYMTRRVPIQIPPATCTPATAGTTMRLDAHPRPDADGNAGPLSDITQRPDSHSVMSPYNHGNCRFVRQFPSRPYNDSTARKYSRQARRQSR